jgi:hypothetical protein
MATLASTDTKSLVGIDFVQHSVVEVLNETFDPKEVARGNALAKLDKGKKKKKKKGSDEDEATDEPSVSEGELEALADAAAAEAKPFGIQEAMVTPATRPEFGDYQINAAMGLAKAVGMNPR